MLELPARDQNLTLLGTPFAVPAREIPQERPALKSYAIPNLPRQAKEKTVVGIKIDIPGAVDEPQPPLIA